MTTTNDCTHNTTVIGGLWAILLVSRIDKSKYFEDDMPRFPAAFSGMIAAMPSPPPSLAYIADIGEDAR